MTLSGSIPERVVLCFFQELIDELAASGSLVEVGADSSEMGRHPIFRYQARTAGQPRDLLVMHPGVGAPLVVGSAEPLIALGANKLMICGGCGVLLPEIAAGHPVILTSAVRDEGTSYHYLPPSLEAYPHPRAVAALEAACQERGIAYRKGKAWTTDGYYRETSERTALRVSQGCEVVEMEASALFAMAEFRGAVLGQIVYGGDLVLPDAWDSRAWNHRTHDRRLLFELAIDACLRL